MKKLFYILFAFFFTVITIGVSISKHYSGDELYSFAIYGEAQSCCEVPCDCCDEVSDFIQFTAEYLNSPHAILHHNDVIVELFNVIRFPEIVSSTDENDIYRIIFPVDFHPPRETTVFLAFKQAYLL